MTLLCCFAHPDDAELWAGGTVHCHVNINQRVVIICFDTGEPERNKEAQKAAITLGVEKLTLLPRHQVWWQGSDDDLDKIINIIIDEKPTIILTHSFDDTHPEHSLMAKLVVKATIRAQDILNRKIQVYETSTYLGQTLNGLFTPTTFIDISEVWSKKELAIRHFITQMPETLLSFIDSQTRFYGSLCGVTRAEGFRRYPILGIAY